MNRKVLFTLIIVCIAVGSILLIHRKEETEHIKIGALIPLTGKLASYGEDMRNALTLAQEELKKSGGTRFEIVYEDSAADPKTAISGARKLVDADKVPLVIGGPGSSGNLAAAPVFEETQTLFFPFSNTAKLNTAGPYTFKVNPDIDIEVRAMGEYVRTKGYTRVGVLYDSSNDVPTTGANLFREQLHTGGGDAVFFQGVDSKITTDFRTQLTLVKQAAPDALYIIVADKLAGVAVRQARELGLNTPILGWSSFNAAEFFSGGGPAAEGVVITDHPFSCIGADTVQDYCAKYERNFSGRQATLYGAQAYDVLRILSEVLKDSQSFGERERGKVQRAFTSHAYNGISGDLSFDEGGNVREKDILLRVAKDGTFVDVK